MQKPETEAPDLRLGPARDPACGKKCHGRQSLQIAGTNIYESEGIVDVWLNAYAIEKERQFIKCISKFIPSSKVELLDIGCGTGLHTYLWTERNKRVTASDSSTRFRDHILRTYSFPFIWDDVLNCTIEAQYDICFCMAIATILLDEGRRHQTFETLARLVRAGSFLVLITPSNQRLFRTRSDGVLLHCIDDRDIGKLKDLGLAVERVFYWSCSPRFLWRSPGLKALGSLVEEIGFRLGIGARKVVICRRQASELAE